MSNQIMPEDFSEWNELMVAKHDPELFHHHPRGAARWIENSRVKTVVRLLAAKPEHKVLDVGCGAGNVLERLSGGTLQGLDLSKRMVEHAQKRLGAKAKIELGDAENLPFTSTSFDRVLCSSVLSHVLHPDRVLEECFRVLKPGGRLVVSVSHEVNIERGMNIARSLGLSRILLTDKSKPDHDHVYNSEYHLHHFSRKLLREFAKKLPPESKMKSIPNFLMAIHVAAVYEKKA